MRGRRLLGLAMIGIGLVWLTGQFFDGGHTRGRSWEDDWEANIEAWEANAESWEANMERDWENWERNFERNLEDGEGVVMPAIPEMPAMPAMPAMPEMSHFEGHNHWFGWWKAPLLLVGAMLLLMMRRRSRMGHGEHYNATVHRF